MLRRRTAAFIAIGAVLSVTALGAGGWAVMTSMDHSFTFAATAPSKTPTAAPTPVDEEEAAKLAAEKAAKGLTVGAVLTAEQAKTISHYWQGNLLPYKMADGTQVLIARDQPLPENVREDAGKRVGLTNQADAAANDSTLMGVAALQRTLRADTGHRVYIVSHAYTYLLPDAEAMGWTWVSSAIGGQEQFPDAAAAVAASRAKAGPDAEIIVSQ
ncbi:hypothetical protein [Leifsonia sp. fls2-241-R2A-40a]|uniref:hypothetical protein n=1 Tax=Leifsonia sp. fls2-241-R2A-40a TaxID=3040290 RepID=UPI00254A49D9|nr:hypothetical protein [Leifsonia sp. fls2-241-R2A-40a]